MARLDTIETWMQEAIVPQAEQMDVDPLMLFEGFQKLGDRDLLALRLPQEAGGQGWDEATFSQFQILIASYSGALAFLTTQHQSALRMLQASPNQALKPTPALLQGQRGIGVGFSHLRRPGPPMMKAIPDESGYLLSGTAPWVTGLGCFDGFICGARLPTQEILMGWVPLDAQLRNAHYHCSQPMALTAMASTQTVAVELESWQMSASEVIAVHAPGWLHQKDQVNTLHHGFYALGSARAALRLMDRAVSPEDSEVLRAIASLRDQYELCQSRMFQLLPQRQHCPDDCLAAKAQVIDLAGRCAQAAIALVGGRANAHDHPAQRIYREVLAFTVFGQTAASKRATLAALSSSFLA